MLYDLTELWYDMLVRRFFDGRKNPLIIEFVVLISVEFKNPVISVHNKRGKPPIVVIISFVKDARHAEELGPGAPTTFVLHSSDLAFLNDAQNVIDQALMRQIAIVYEFDWHVD